MTTWQEEYIEALKDRDKREKLDYELIDACRYHSAFLTRRLTKLDTRLADRAAALEAEKAAIISSKDSGAASKDSSPNTVTADMTIQLKSDLAEALRAKGQLQSRLKVAEDELVKLRLKSKTDTKIIKDLYAERGALIIKVRDRGEELKGKAKLLEVSNHDLFEQTMRLTLLQDVQDEVVSLNLQLNMAEQRSKKLQGENKDLIDRWMARMGQEADAMNDASRFS